jgi:hypothetical protein
MSAIAAERQLWRPAVPLRDHQVSALSIATPRPGQALETSGVPAVVSGAAPAPAGKSARCRTSRCCLTCNMRNEVTSHVSQLALEASSGNN